MGIQGDFVDRLTKASEKMRRAGEEEEGESLLYLVDVWTGTRDRQLELEAGLV